MDSNEVKLDDSSKNITNITTSPKVPSAQENIQKNFVEDNIIKKQQIIKEKIIDKGYDKNKFFFFCMSEKPDKGDDLSNWNQEEIESVINSFISQENVLKNDLSQIENDIQNNKSIQLTLQQNNSVQTEKNNELIINCIKIEKSLLNDKVIKVELKNPKVIKAGSLSSNFVTYEVNTSSSDNTLNWVVERRYSDFFWLRETLVRLYPFIFVPPLPSKKIGNRRFEMDFITKRMSGLNIFLNEIMKNEEFKASEAVNSFLNLADRNRFDDLRKMIDSSQLSNNLEGIRNLDGFITISLDDYNHNRFATNIKNYFAIQYKILDRVNEDFSAFYKSLKEAANGLEDVQKDFQLLHLLNKRVDMKSELLSTFEEYGIFFKNWKRVLFNQNVVIKENIKNFFKKVKSEGTAFEDIIKKREKVKSDYDDLSKKLLAKKEKLWAQMDISKWEIANTDYNIDRVSLVRDKQYAFSKMCTTETNEQENLRKKLGYANKSTVDQLKLLVGKYQKTFLENVKLFANEFYPTLCSGLDVWTKLASSVDA